MAGADPRALELGVVAVAGLPLALDGVRLGALGLYDTHARAWTSDAVAAAQVLVNMATNYLARASELEYQRRANEQLAKTLESRLIIEQAKGILAVERKINRDEAFELLTERARAHDSSVRAVATAVVNLGLRS